MTAKGELYANEDCGEFAQEALDKKFGKHRWYLDGNQWGGEWDLSNLPDKMEIPILKDDEEGDDLLGILIVKNRFYVSSGMYVRYVDVEPESFRIAEICKHKDCKNPVPEGKCYIYLQEGYCSNNCRFDKRQ